MILDSLVEQVEVCVCGGAGQGITTKNSHSIPRSYNAAMCHRKRAIQLVARFTFRMNSIDVHNRLFTNHKLTAASGQLRIPG